jgi:CheY-like chemotaxis protein
MNLKGKYIYIIEDNLQNRVVFQMALTRQGAFVDFDRWGRDAVFHLENTSRVDLIVLDLMLANGVSGFDLYDEIRAIPTTATVPIVAVSAMDAAVAVPIARKKGFNGFIAKPIDYTLFPQQLLSIMNGEPVWYTGVMNLT